MIRIVEVGPRDGLQNEATPIPTERKAAFIRALAAAGLKEIEATSFVSPKWVPQLGDAAELLARLVPPPALLSALVPNMKGLERALETSIERIALFTAASDAFTQKNIAMSVEESLQVFGEVAAAFRAARPGGWIRGYVSTAFECPYAGRIAPARTVEVARRLIEIGMDEVSIGDTIGVASPREVRALCRAMAGEIPTEKIAFHFHDTRGTAIATVAEGLAQGITAFDSSAGGLGGCPFAPGAGGNLATEDLIYFLEREGIATGVDLAALAHASLPILSALGRAPVAKAQLAALSASPPK
ncbi:MAG: hydroxymethylglutaryl-CoA lyase [Fimbriimonas ginsengisoli]|uniref:Hydroxymethylglutaryl-CoA lyase n=1 Tax=Fimbriimonas ginsengisoli TaxID=1005039 RepID=A0A931LWJ9_FIMGI|nr:hydroxymethylglutaryl-CoA lyase [Fimbriimonas ginsengisoli]